MFGRAFVRFSFSILAVPFFFTACSSMGGGAGDGTFSDQDLAANANKFDGAIPVPTEDGLFQDVHFGYDSADVAPEYRETIMKNAQYLVNDQTLRAEIEGHCDKRGTNDYNLALGEARARSVATMMVSAGVRAEQLSTISYGEEVPLDPSETEEAYAKNRRAHFALFRQK